MRKFISLSLTILFVLHAAATAQERFSQYRRIEAYEVRPGISMMPRYTAANDVCEIGLEQMEYSPALVRLKPNISRGTIYRILDELVPTGERGKLVEDSGDEIIQRGQGAIALITAATEYENVFFRIYSVPLSTTATETTMDPIVAVVKWKNRICRDDLPPTAAAKLTSKPRGNR